MKKQRNNKDNIQTGGYFSPGEAGEERVKESWVAMGNVVAGE